MQLQGLGGPGRHAPFPGASGPPSAAGAAEHGGETSKPQDSAQSHLAETFRHFWHAFGVGVNAIIAPLPPSQICITMNHVQKAPESPWERSRGICPQDRLGHFPRGDSFHLTGSIHVTPGCAPRARDAILFSRLSQSATNHLNPLILRHPCTAARNQTICVGEWRL